MNSTPETRAILLIRVRDPAEMAPFLALPRPVSENSQPEVLETCQHPNGFCVSVVDQRLLRGPFDSSRTRRIASHGIV